MDKFGNEVRVRYGSGTNPVWSGGFKSGSVRYACKLGGGVVNINQNEPLRLGSRSFASKLIFHTELKIYKSG